MPTPKKSPWRRFALTTSAAVLIVAVTSITAAAVARTLTLQVDRNAKVTNIAGKTKTEAIVLNSGGRAVYELSGDRRGHAECTGANSCFAFWPPVTVSAPQKLTKAAGIRGKLGTWHRNSFFQATLNGHPLYRFSQDHKPRAAVGDGIVSFGGTWHVIRASAAALSPGSSMTSSSSSSSMSSSSQCLYPPC